MPTRDLQDLEPGARQLCFHGVLLLALGLVTGFAVPFVTTPRIGLSAHLAGVQSGMLLVILGLLWPRLAFAPAAEAAARWLALGSLYATWLGILIAATFGATRTLPIAGAGSASQAAGWQSAGAGILIVGGALASLVAVALVLRGFKARRA